MNLDLSLVQPTEQQQQKNPNDKKTTSGTPQTIDYPQKRFTLKLKLKCNLHNNNITI